jgi:hypothetical protein
MFSAKLTHSYFLGMSGAIWLTADLFVILSAAALVQAVTTRSPAWLLAALLAAVLGVLSYSTAIYSLFVLLLFCLALLFVPKFRGLLPNWALIGTAVVVVVLVGLGLLYRHHPQSHPAFDFDPVGLVKFVLIYLGNALATGPMRLVAGLLILVIGALSIRRLIADGRTQGALLWIVLFFFAPFNAVMTGIGRLGYGVKVAATSRYQSVTALTLIAMIVLLLAALPKGEVPRRARLIRNAAIAFLVVVAVMLAANRAYVQNYAKRNENKIVAEIALRQGIESDDHLRAATGATGQFDRILPDLRAARHVPFNARTRCEDMLGQSVAESEGAPAGALETAASYAVSHEKGNAVALSGWAERDGSPAECIVIVDGARTIIGAGAAMLFRPDIEHTEKRSFGRIGWKAVATVPQNLPLCAFALFPGQSRLVPLSNCLASVEIPPAGQAGPKKP